MFCTITSTRVISKTKLSWKIECIKKYFGSVRVINELLHTLIAIHAMYI